MAELEAPRSLQLLADPLRWRLLSELAGSDRRVGELCSLVGEPQSLVSYHLKELRQGGLVSARRSSFDGRDSYYRAELARCRELLADAAGLLHPSLALVPLPTEPVLSRGRRPRVLFLCTGNSARSQMAEALITRMSGGRVEARSAGSHPKSLHANAVAVMAERGIDISTNRTQHLNRFARAHFDWVVTLCDRVREVCPEFPGDPHHTHWSIPDPAAAGSTDVETYEAFQQTAADLEMRIGRLLARLSLHEGARARAL